MAEEPIMCVCGELAIRAATGIRNGEKVVLLAFCKGCIKALGGEKALAKIVSKVNREREE